ncbi:MAG: hypothetical protein GYA34_08565 [Chloroflexi bacterium]|nr:hypothetical protein [Chloroflexota bacterium]
MNQKENALRIIHFNQPEWVMEQPPCFIVSYQGCDHEGYEGIGDEHPAGSSWVDIWGVGWHKELEGMMGLPKLCPLENPRNLKLYRWPDPDDERIVSRIYRPKKEYVDETAFLTGSHRDTLWEKAYMLVGMQKLMGYFFTEPEFVKDVFHHIMDFQLGIAQHYLKIGVEMVKMTDDLGIQTGPLLGPRIVSKFLIPEYQRLFQLYKEKQVLINFHSCGNVLSILEPLMELGADILNPIQASANDLNKVRQMTQDRLALQGGVSSKTVLEGTESEITAEVIQRISQLGRKGGYFCCPDQTMPYPQENLNALSSAVKQYGKYPLTI